MHIYLFLFALCNLIISCYGAASSSAQPTICLIDNPAKQGLHFQVGRGGLFSVTNSIISEQALHNDRRRQGFPTEFTLRYCRQDGTWYCSNHYAMPNSFTYYNCDEILQESNDKESQITKHVCTKKEIKNAIKQGAPQKNFPDSSVDCLGTPLPQDIEIYLELNRFDGPLLPTVADYFGCFKALSYLSLKRLIYHYYFDYCPILNPAAIFSHMQQAAQHNTPLTLEEPNDVQSKLPTLKIGDIPPWPAQCIRSKESLTLRACLNPTLPAKLDGRIIDLRNHTIAIDELKSIPGEGHLLILSTRDDWRDPNPSVKVQISQNEVTEINNHLAQQHPLRRRYLDTFYSYRYHLAAGVATAVAAAYIYNNHHDLVLKRAREIAPIAEQLALQRTAYQALKKLIDTANNTQTVVQMTADEMRTILSAHIDIATVTKEIYRLQDLMPDSWTMLHSLIAAIKNSIGKITGIMFGTYVADVGTKYFLGYRPYQPSRIHVQNHFHDYHHDKIPYWDSDFSKRIMYNDTEQGYCCSLCSIKTETGKPRNFDALLPHYDEATEARFKRNQSLAILGAFVGIPFAATLWYAMRQAK
jgi:hypothetical protein